MNEIKEAIKNKAVYLSANKIGILNANFIKVAQETQELEPCSDGEREDDEYDEELFAKINYYQKLLKVYNILIKNKHPFYLSLERNI